MLARMASPRRVSDTPLSGPETARVAAAADVDVRSVSQVLRGANVRPRTYRRVVRALRKLGLGHLAPTLAEESAR